MVNSILGGLVREHFPGVVRVGQGESARWEPAWMWAHYKKADDTLDRMDRCYESKAERVKTELWDFYRLVDGYEEKAAEVQEVVCKKLVLDMHYEAQVQSTINYHAARKVKINKVQARTIKLTMQEYEEAPVSWCRNDAECWKAIVARWFDPEFIVKREAGRQKCLLKPKGTHHQGSRSNKEYRKRWSKAHGDAPCNEFQGWLLSKKGKATALENTYNPNDPPEAYDDPSIHTRATTYTETGRQIHGPEQDLTRVPLDGEVIMRIGGGKAHGHFYIGDSILDAASFPNLVAIRAKDTDTSPPIVSRASAALAQMERLQVRLDEQEAALSRVAQSAVQHNQQLALHNSQVSQLMAQWTANCMVAIQKGEPVPPMPLIPPPPQMAFIPIAPGAATPTNQSAASKNLEASPGMSLSFPQVQLFPSLPGVEPSPSNPPPSS